VLIVSCKNAPNKKFIGNWASYNNDEGYVEFIIRDSIVEIYSHWNGNKGAWWYKIQNDSIEIQHGFKGQIRLINDSVFTISGEDTKDTLYRLGDSILTYNSNLMSSGIEGNEILFKEFYIQFLKRMNMFLLNHKIIEPVNNDTTPIIEDKIIQGGERK
jgi:hypothetical protein